MIGTGSTIAYEGAGVVAFSKWGDCIELSNDDTRVVLGERGGRVLSYEAGGENVLYLSADETARMPTGGRFDVGPEMMQLRGEAIWFGEWESEIIGDRSARLTSVVDPKSDLQVTREFTLAADSSKLTVIQNVTNLGKETARVCYWSRTFARHGGTAIVPLTPGTSGFPKGYVMYESGKLINVKPEDPAIRRDGDSLLVTGPPKFPKLGFDTSAGWVAYQNHDQLFVKRYVVDPAKPYGEATGMTLSIWYPKEERLPACEIEPIGPMATLAPGENASYAVDWYLFERRDEEGVDPGEVAEFIKLKTEAPKG